MKILTRCRLVPLVVAFILVSGVLLTGEAVAGHGGVHRHTGGFISFKQTATNPQFQTIGPLQFFVAVPFMTASVPIGPNRTALINARFFAESQCTGPSAGAWCSIRILIAGIPGEPNQGDGSDYAFDSVHNPQDFSEGHALERHLCVRNLNTTTTRFATVIVQRRVVGPAGTSFRLDEMSLTAERSDNCAPVDLTIQ
jgi:hypothetical protein